MARAADTDSPQPLFAVLAAGARPLGAALASPPSPPIANPWLPQAKAEPARDDAALARRAAELAAAKQQAIEEGRAEGLRETAKLRDALKALLLELAASREAKTAKTAEAIADCAIAAIEGYVMTAPPRELLAPVVKTWIERAGTAPATAKIHPSQLIALQETIGDAPIEVETDATMQPGDLKIRGESLDMTHAWGERLKQLRDAIATALETA